MPLQLPPTQGEVFHCRSSQALGQYVSRHLNILVTDSTWAPKEKGMMSSEALLPAFGTGCAPAGECKQNAYNKNKLLAGTPLVSITEILIQCGAIQTAKGWSHSEDMYRTQTAFCPRISFVEENLTLIKLPNDPTRQAHCYQGIQQQRYEALKSSQSN